MIRVFLIITILLAGTFPATAKVIPCVAVDLIIKWAGSTAAAAQLAASHGYSQAQIDEAIKRCVRQRK